ncbi:MAG: aldo/keto reductase [Candidatus Latescibacterota bacterium]|nr:MAG: aldo/keto reductase [Candidatus Latescibacterota bacterium]
MDTKELNEGRRGFLKKGVTGLAGMAILPSVLSGEARAESEEKKTKKSDKIIYRKFGKTGLKLPIVSMGVMNADNPELVKAALDAGIVHLDTAHAYQRGRNEEMIGGVIKDMPRDSFVIATKIAMPQDRRTGRFTDEATPEGFMEKFETSLKRLGLDYVDILYLHSIVSREDTLHEPFLNVMQKLKQEGRIRFIGVSTHRNEPEVIRTAVESKIYDVVLTAYNFRQPHVAEVEKAMEEADKAGVGVVVMKTQAGVFWDRERQHPINMKAALKWALQKEYVHTSIPGFTEFDQLELDLSVMEDLKLTPAEELDLSEDKQMGVTGMYCDQCSKCVPQCAKGVEIPTLMRSYMYAYGYRNLAVAKDTLESRGISDVPCERCDACTVKCTMNFDVRNKIRDIARIRQVPDDFIV